MVERSKYLRDKDKWQAVALKEKQADGCFYYAVVTTGIFCNPSCSSRMPNHENVIFFNSTQEAVKAGYRPCKRCRPIGMTKAREVEAKIIAACRKIERSEKSQTLEGLAMEAGLSPHYFHRLFKKIVGLTPKQYSLNYQSTRLKENLKKSSSVTDAIYESGYNSSSVVYRKSGNSLAMMPKEYRAGGAGLTIQYGTAKCFLGLLVVAATDIGICAIEFIDEHEDAGCCLAERFPKARIEKAGPEFKRLVEVVVQHIQSPNASINLPLDIQGTVFQQKVWTVLRQIKPGVTMTYSEVAEKIGRPEAFRAVASACGANRLAVVIPCHRVIAKSGKVSGYRWGVERKRVLLDRESKESED